MLRKLYNWTLSLADKPYALLALVGVAFAESSFFPIPPDVLLIPMTLAKPERAYIYAFWTSVASVLGGISGYAIGALLYGSVGQYLIQFYGLGDDMLAFRAAYIKYGAWIILLKGLTPIPYKLVTIASGFAGYDLVSFILLSIVARGARFYIVAALLRAYGEPIRDFIDKQLPWVTLGAVALIVGGFVIVRYI